MRSGGRYYPRYGPRSTGVIQESDRPLGLSLGLGSSVIRLAVSIVRPVHAEEVEPVPDIVDDLGERLFVPGVVGRCLLAACDMSISILAS